MLPSKWKLCIFWSGLRGDTPLGWMRVAPAPMGRPQLPSWDTLAYIGWPLCSRLQRKPQSCSNPRVLTVTLFIHIQALQTGANHPSPDLFKSLMQRLSPKVRPNGSKIFWNFSSSVISNVAATRPKCYNTGRAGHGSKKGRRQVYPLFQGFGRPQYIPQKHFSQSPPVKEMWKEAMMLSGTSIFRNIWAMNKNPCYIPLCWLVNKDLIKAYYNHHLIGYNPRMTQNNQDFSIGHSNSQVLWT